MNNKIDFVILRIFNLYLKQSKQNIIPDIKEKNIKKKSNKKIKIIHPKTSRDFYLLMI